MKEDDMAGKKSGSSKHALDFRGGERGGGNEKEKSVFFGGVLSVANCK